jgi:hypothetical protein
MKKVESLAPLPRLFAYLGMGVITGLVIIVGQRFIMGHWVNPVFEFLFWSIGLTAVVFGMSMRHSSDSNSATRQSGT